MVFNKCVKYYREDLCPAFNTYLDKSIKKRIMYLQKLDRKREYSYLLIDNDDVDYANGIYLQVEDNDEYHYQTNLSEFENKMISYLNENISFIDICIKENCNVKSIYNALTRIKNKNNVKSIRDNKKMSTLEKNTYDLHLKGYKASDIAYLLGKDINTIYNALKRAKSKNLSLKDTKK